MSALKVIDRVARAEPAFTRPLVSLSQIFERRVFGLLGVPVDVVGLEEVVRHLDVAKAKRTPYVLSTPNLNFLVLSQSDRDFRESLLASDLCPADGMPIVWLSRLLGIPLTKRLPGSDIFDALKQRQTASPMRVFFFGGAEGVADTVAKRINAECPGMVCVGTISPDYCTVEDMSSSAFLDQINSSNADFVAAFLSAKKGQEWVMKNAAALSVPVRAQLGATINFQAGTVRRAPALLRGTGLEWLWRIKEEPHLWRRYWRDGLALIRIALTTVIPILILRALSRQIDDRQELRVRSTHDGLRPILYLSGPATLPNIERLQDEFSKALAGTSDLTVDLSETTDVDPRFFGLLIVVRKILKTDSRQLRLVNPSATIKRLFRLHGFAYLLDSSR